ncbi:acyltransferase [Spirosoma humi]
MPTPTAALKQSGQSTPYIPVLTGLRALAAYLVFLHHYNPAPVGTFANRLFQQGYIGVSVFFILSGFLIHHRYADHYLDRVNWSWRRYLQNRFARIFPLYVLLLLITVCVNELMGHPMRLFEFALNLTLLKGFSETYLFSGIAQSWSLTVELCFYLAAPFLFMGLNRWGPLPLTALLIGFGLLIWTTNLFFGDADIGRGAARWLPFLFFYTFFGRSFEFVAGMWLALQYRQNQLPTVPHTTKMGLLLMSGCVLWQSSASQRIARPMLLAGSEVVAYNFVLPVGICLFLLGLLGSNSGLRRVLSHSIVQLLGRSSYAFYLIHVGVVAHGLQRAGVANYGLLFGLLALIAHGLYIFIEKPLHRWLRARE